MVIWRPHETVGAYGGASIATVIVDELVDAGVGFGRGVIGPEDFPLMRHLHAVVAKDEPLDMPWESFFGGS